MTATTSTCSAITPRVSVTSENPRAPRRQAQAAAPLRLEPVQREGHGVGARRQRQGIFAGVVADGGGRRRQRRRGGGDHHPAQGRALRVADPPGEQRRLGRGRRRAREPGNQEAGEQSEDDRVSVAGGGGVGPESARTSHDRYLPAGPIRSREIGRVRRGRTVRTGKVNGLQRHRWSQEHPADKRGVAGHGGLRRQVVGRMPADNAAPPVMAAGGGSPRRIRAACIAPELRVVELRSLHGRKVCPNLRGCVFRVFRVARTIPRPATAVRRQHRGGSWGSGRAESWVSRGTGRSARRWRSPRNGGEPSRAVSVGCSCPRGLQPGFPRRGDDPGSEPVVVSHPQPRSDDRGVGVRSSFAEPLGRPCRACHSRSARAASSASSSDLTSPSSCRS